MGSVVLGLRPISKKSRKKETRTKGGDPNTPWDRGLLSFAYIYFRYSYRSVYTMGFSRIIRVGLGFVWVGALSETIAKMSFTVVL